MFILDSDHLSLLQNRKSDESMRLLFRMSAQPRSHFFVAIVSFHEQVNGWIGYISKSKDSSGLVRGYMKLNGILSNFAKAQVLPFSTAAAHIYDELKTQSPRVGAMDLRIGAIALANQMTVLTRNTVDFERIPNLMIEDCTVA